MISVEEARARIIAAFQPLGVETVPLAGALGRVLAADVAARRDQPPVAMSSMDGWAVRHADVRTLPARLRQVGVAPAGGAYAGTLGPGEAVRIFTGGPVPAGADAIVIQEDAELSGDVVSVREAGKPGQFIRPAGLDFRAGDVGLRAGTLLGARALGLAAAMNVPSLQVRRRPRVALLSTGDELVPPGETPGPYQIVSSNSVALAALVNAHGAEAVDLGIARDTADDLRRAAAGARGCDLLVTAGGASVGDHDLVHAILGRAGAGIDFWRIAMRPGKPLMFGRAELQGGAVPLLGLPGNPVSALVCALVFLLPAIRRMLGLPNPEGETEQVALGADLPANDRRQDYLRARLERNAGGQWTAYPFPRQDSSMLTPLAAAHCLIVRAPNAPPARAGDAVSVIRLDRAGL
jgi:molybdopterin molybdotransferase